MKRSGSISQTAFLWMTEIYDKGYALFMAGTGGWALALTVAMVVFAVDKEEIERFVNMPNYPRDSDICALCIPIRCHDYRIANFIQEGSFCTGHMMLLGVMLMPADHVFPDWRNRHRFV